ncbi:MAG: undecaprenyl-phosphate glucose phosphotransferase [Crocinitomicaceae bacterium]|nr:undecaprenyl-phosphate glucose phosphotransferase [Crocinitomicaceae bacterium]
MVNRKIRNFVTKLVKHTKLLLLFIDIILLNISFFVALFIRFGGFKFPYEDDYLRLLFLGNIMWGLLIGVFDGYKTQRSEPVEATLKRIIRMVFVHFLLLMMVSYVIDTRHSSRLMLFIFLGVFMFGAIAYRVIMFQMLKYLRRRGVNHRNVAIVGYNNNAKEIYEVLTSDISTGYRVRGFFTDENVDEEEINYLGNIDSIEEELSKWKIEELYVALTTTNANRVKHIFKICDRKGVRLKIIPDFHKYTSSHVVQISYYNHIPVLRMRGEPLARFRNKLVKRSFDIAFSLIVVLGFLSWIFPIVAILTKLTSKGPVLFKQQRSGLDGHTFTCFKIRTMVTEAESKGTGTVKNDPRVTGFGKFLRKSRIDELPQFVNVLIGNMSVVGPRPHMLVHTEKYGELINAFMVRHYVKPGITGWAQTVGELDPEHKLTEMREKVKNDIWYIENWSFLLDLKIIVNTTLKVLLGDKNAN